MTLGLVFPGQGSQSVGMLADVAREFPQVTATFAEASTVVGYDLWQVTAEGPAEQLDKTTTTQPALLAASYAIWQILLAEKNIQPALLAGHSLGEYTALVCAGALSFKDAIKLVAARGEFMQDAVPVGTGALAAIVGLDDAIVAEICQKAALTDTLAPANFNSIGQVVIAGHTAAVERALVLAREAGAKIAKMLPVSVPSHCSLMQPAAERLAKLLQTITIQQPRIPVLNNVDVTVYNSEAAIRDGLVRQLVMPVRWVKTIQVFAQQGITRIVECGPGKVLSGLNKRINAELQLASTADAASIKNI